MEIEEKYIGLVEKEREMSMEIEEDYIVMEEWIEYMK